MTVAEIQEYIDERIAEAEQELKNHEIHIDIKNHINILDIVSSMLDELEPKAKWEHDGSQWKNRFICSKCGHKIFEEQQPYCSNCGARMEVENDTTPTNV